MSPNKKQNKPSNSMSMDVSIDHSFQLSDVLVPPNICATNANSTVIDIEPSIHKATAKSPFVDSSVSSISVSSPCNDISKAVGCSVNICQDISIDISMSEQKEIWAKSGTGRTTVAVSRKNATKNYPDDMEMTSENVSRAGVLKPISEQQYQKQRPSAVQSKVNAPERASMDDSDMEISMSGARPIHDTVTNKNRPVMLEHSIMNNENNENKPLVKDNGSTAVGIRGGQKKPFAEINVPQKLRAMRKSEEPKKDRTEKTVIGETEMDYSYTGVTNGDSLYAFLENEHDCQSINKGYVPNAQKTIYHNETIAGAFSELLDPMHTEKIEMPMIKLFQKPKDSSPPEGTARNTVYDNKSIDESAAFRGANGANVAQNDSVDMSLETEVQRDRKTIFMNNTVEVSLNNAEHNTNDHFGLKMTDEIPICAKSEEINQQIQTEGITKSRQTILQSFAMDQSLASSGPQVQNEQFDSRYEHADQKTKIKLFVRKNHTMNTLLDVSITQADDKENIIKRQTIHHNKTMDVSLEIPASQPGNSNNAQFIKRKTIHHHETIDESFQSSVDPSVATLDEKHPGRQTLHNNKTIDFSLETPSTRPGTSDIAKVTKRETVYHHETIDESMQNPVNPPAVSFKDKHTGRRTLHENHTIDESFGMQADKSDVNLALRKIAKYDRTMDESFDIPPDDSTHETHTRRQTIPHSQTISESFEIQETQPEKPRNEKRRTIHQNQPMDESWTIPATQPEKSMMEKSSSRQTIHHSHMVDESFEIPETQPDMPLEDKRKTVHQNQPMDESWPIPATRSEMSMMKRHAKRQTIHHNHDESFEIPETQPDMPDMPLDDKRKTIHQNHPMDGSWSIPANQPEKSKMQKQSNRQTIHQNRTVDESLEIPATQSQKISTEDIDQTVDESVVMDQSEYQIKSNEIIGHMAHNKDRKSVTIDLITPNQSKVKTVHGNQTLGEAIDLDESAYTIGNPVRPGPSGEHDPTNSRKTTHQIQSIDESVQMHQLDEINDPVRNTCNRRSTFVKQSFVSDTNNSFVKYQKEFIDMTAINCENIDDEELDLCATSEPTIDKEVVGPILESTDAKERSAQGYLQEEPSTSNGIYHLEAKANETSSVNESLLPKQPKKKASEIKIDFSAYDQFDDVMMPLDVLPKILEEREMKRQLDLYSTDALETTMDNPLSQNIEAPSLKFLYDNKAAMDL